MTEARLEIVSVDSALDFEAAARGDRYQLVTGPGALGILEGMDRSGLDSCLRNCAMATSVGVDCADVEDLLDDVYMEVQGGSDDGFFATVSAQEFDDNVWIVIHQAQNTPRLLALSSQSGFASQVESWIDQARASVSEGVHD